MKIKEKNALVIIDPQNDFCDPEGSLYVEGAKEDISRLSRYIEGSVSAISDIYVSLDSHDPVSIFHPWFWIDENGKSPAPFSEITKNDYSSGRWNVAVDNRKHVKRTFEQMGFKGINSVTVWPVHCVVSTWGHQLPETLHKALTVWGRSTGKAVRYIFKGENPYTDQYSIFEGLDSTWPETAFNEPLFETLSAFKSLTFAGEALSHCVSASIISYLERRGESKQLIALLADCTSPVSGFKRQTYLDVLELKGVSFVSSECKV